MKWRIYTLVICLCDQRLPGLRSNRLCCLMCPSRRPELLSHGNVNEDTVPGVTVVLEGLSRRIPARL
jgi:hypothetical protein